MKKNIALVLSKFLGGVFITCLILLLARFTYNKGKFEYEVKLEEFQQEYPKLKGIKLGYYGLFSRNKKNYLIYNDFLKYKDDYETISFYYFNLESSHKEIVIVLKDQPNNLFTFKVGPPQLVEYSHVPTFEDKIPKGFYLIEEHYGFGLKEEVSIRYWTGELNVLLEDYMKNRLGTPTQRIELPFSHLSLFQRLLHPDVINIFK